MKLSNETLNVLKNFATINPSLAFDVGNTLRTLSPNKTILAEATIPDTITQDFAIYDLSRFLGVLSLFEQPDLELGDKSLSIRSPNRNVTYTYADRSTFITPPAKNLKLPSVDVEFNLAGETFVEALKALGVMSLPELAVVGEDGRVFLRCFDSKNPSSNKYDVDLDATTGSEFTTIFRVENLKIVPRDYTVQISSQGISHFKSDKLQYWVSIESNSKFE